MSLSPCSPEPYESCEQASEGAFGYSDGKTIAMAGAPFSDCLDDGVAHSATMAAVFTVPATNDLGGMLGYGLDYFTSLPGPGAVAIPYTVKLLP